MVLDTSLSKIINYIWNLLRILFTSLTLNIPGLRDLVADRALLPVEYSGADATTLVQKRAYLLQELAGKLKSE